MSWETRVRFILLPLESLAETGPGEAVPAAPGWGISPWKERSSFFLPGIISAPKARCPAPCPENGSGSGRVRLLTALLTPGGAGLFPGPRERFH